MMYRVYQNQAEELITLGVTSLDRFYNLPKMKSFITKTYLYNIDPLEPHFYIVKLEFTGVYIIFLISAQKHICFVLKLEKNIGIFRSFQFLEVKFSIYLNRRVFVMSSHFSQEL